MFASVKRLYKNTALRFSLIAAALFVLSSLVVLGYIYYATVRTEIIKIDALIEQELDDIEGVYKEIGEEGTMISVLSRMREGQYYVLSLESKNSLETKNFVSNLDDVSVSKISFKEGEVFTLTYPKASDGTAFGKEETRVRGKSRNLDDTGSFIFVAREADLILDMSERIKRTLFISVILVLILGILFGFYEALRNKKVKKISHSSAIEERQSQKLSPTANKPHKKNTIITSVKRLFKSTVFRLSLIAAVLFVLSSFIVLSYIYYATVKAATAEVDRQLAAELDNIEKIYLTQDPNQGVNTDPYYGPKRAFEFLSSRNLPGRVYIYQHAKIAFINITEKPIVEKGHNEGQPFSFVYSVKVSEDPVVTKEIRARGQSRFLKNEGFIFAGRDIELITEASEKIRRALFVSMLIALALGILSGVYVSSRFAKRIAAFNKLATDIRSGKLDMRAQRTDTGDELDVLAENLNGMLDHIDKLMLAMRYAGDSIAHDLRSPLTRLRTRLETAGADIQDKTAQEALFKASDDAGELLRTFDSVLRIARLEAGERREMLVELNPAPLLEDIAELYEPACEDAGLEFSMEITGKHKLLGDRGLLSQAVSNLVENAIKYTPKGSAITVRLRKTRNGRTEISVTDTGPGIPVEQRSRVKERFVRLEESRTAPGSGLGLSLVDAVADLHRAQFELEDGPGGTESKNPGLRAVLIFPRFKRRK